MIAQIIAIGWLACIMVDTYVDWCWQKKIKLQKPFNCQKCMGFWLGLIFCTTKIIYLDKINATTLTEVFLFALLTSLAASIEYAVIRRI
jgi:hypothetical protein